MMGPTAGDPGTAKQMWSSGTRAARRVGLAILCRINPGDLTIKHHHTDDPVRLHSFRHREYWFRGRQRERDSMAAFARLTRPGRCVFDIGGHIGYVSLYFASLVGPAGAVHTFEPGQNNLPYARANLAGRPNIRLVEKAVGRQAGRLTLFLEDLTGQNNSLVPEFELLAANERNAVRATVVEQAVDVITVDGYVDELGVVPDFIKVDVEGFEAEVLAGAQGVLLRHRPTLMVETHGRSVEVEDLLGDLDYRLFTPDGRRIQHLPDVPGNVFCTTRDAW